MRQKIGKEKEKRGPSLLRSPHSPIACNAFTKNFPFLYVEKVPFAALLIGLGHCMSSDFCDLIFLP